MAATPKAVRRERAPLRVAANGRLFLRKLRDSVNQKVPTWKKFVRRRAACRDAKENWTTRAFGLLLPIAFTIGSYFPPADALGLVLVP